MWNWTFRQVSLSLLFRSDSMNPEMGVVAVSWTGFSMEMRKSMNSIPNKDKHGALFRFLSLFLEGRQHLFNVVDFLMVMDSTETL